MQLPQKLELTSTYAVATTKVLKSYLGGVA
jgi:hypothetical protein